MVKDIPKIIIGSVPWPFKNLARCKWFFSMFLGYENEERRRRTEHIYYKGNFSEAGLPYGIFKVLLAIWLSSYDLASIF